MKLNPMSPKIAAVILLATTGATLSITPAQAEEIPSPVTQTIDKYDLASFKTPVFESPEVVSWAVAYTPNITAETELDPAEKALLTDGANLAQKQKTVLENNAAIVRAELQRIAAEKAAAEKAEAEKVAAAKAAAEKLAAEKAEAARKEAEAVAQQQAAQKAAAQAQENARVTAQRAAAQVAATPTPQWNSTAVTAQSAPAPATKSSAPSASANAPASSGIGAALVASAYGQIGIDQDCTAMVEKALRSVGKNVGDIGPSGFYRYGTVVTNPQPGDLMISAGHVAIYVGNGMAISGGFNGGHTELHPASYLAGSVFVRVS